MMHTYIMPNVPTIKTPYMRRRAQEATVRRWQRDISLLQARAAAGCELAALELRSAQTSLAAAEALLATMPE